MSCIYADFLAQEMFLLLKPHNNTEAIEPEIVFTSCERENAVIFFIMNKR